MSRHNWLTTRPIWRSKVSVHGTRAAYNAGCHCAKCRAANAAHARQYLRRRQEAAIRDVHDLLPCRCGCCVERPVEAPTPLAVRLDRDALTGQLYECQVIWNGSR